MASELTPEQVEERRRAAEQRARDAGRYSTCLVPAPELIELCKLAQIGLRAQARHTDLALELPTVDCGACYGQGGRWGSSDRDQDQWYSCNACDASGRLFDAEELPKIFDALHQRIADLSAPPTSEPKDTP
jgi:hypothetical protein